MDVEAQPARGREPRSTECVVFRQRREECLLLAHRALLFAPDPVEAVVFRQRVSREERLLSIRRALLFARDPVEAVVDVTEGYVGRKGKKVARTRPVGESCALMDLVELVQVHGAAAARGEPPGPGSVYGAWGTPLHFACRLELGEYAELLVARGADVTAADSDGLLPLHIAALLGSVRCLRAVSRDGMGGTRDDLLWYPAWSGWEEVVRILVSVGAGIGEWAADGEGALWAAASNGHFRIVRMLVEAGVNVRARTGGEEAVQAARKWGHFEIAQYLDETIERDALGDGEGDTSK